MIYRIYTPILNSILFILFIYFAYAFYGIDKLIPFLIFSIVSALVLSVIGIVKKLGKKYVFISLFPFLISLTVIFLLFTGIGWFILMLFGIHGPTPN